MSINFVHHSLVEGYKPGGPYGDQKRRKRLPWHSVASIGGDQHKLDCEQLKERIKHHAGMRVQIAATVAAVYEATKLGAAPEQGKTYYQGGKGVVEGQSAAHACLTPTLYGNDRSALIERIFKAKNLSKIDRVILKRKGANKNDLKMIEAAITSKQRIAEIIKRVWPFEGILTGSHLETSIMSICHELPYEVNFEIDGRLEGIIRPETVALYQKVAKGEITALEMTKKLSWRIQEILFSFKKDINKRLDELQSLECKTKNTLKILKKINKTKLPNDENRNLLEKQIEEWKQAFEDCCVNMTGAPKARLPEHEEAFEVLENRESLRFIPQQKLLREIEENLHWYQNFEKQIDYQIEGSNFCTKDYLMLFGKKEDQEGSRRELHRNEMLKESLRGIELLKI